MGVNYRAIGSGLDAVKDAIAFYMDLRSQKQDRDRETQADSRAQRQLDILAERERADREDKTADNERAALQFMMTNYGGAPVGAEDVGRFKRQGYGGALEEGMTLPSRKPGGIPLQGAEYGAPEVPSPMRTIEQFSPAEPTGQYNIRMPESEKSRIKYLDLANKSFEGQANRDLRSSEGDKNRAVRSAAIRATLSNAQTAAAMHKYGIDVNDVTRRMAIEETILRNTAYMDNMTFDNMMSGGPLAILRFLGPNGVQFPTPPQPPTRMPLPPVDSSVSGLGDWEKQ